MSVHLLIRDGSPSWWLSPDIWVVPGTDPNGPPGSAVAGQTAYLWAHVTNTGDADAEMTRVDFWWANPALQVLRSTATLLGSAYADIPAGGSQDVLLLVPWVPVFVNGGHECVVVVANNPADVPPLPNPPPDDFAPPAWDQVAQRNLSVLPIGAHSTPHLLTVTASLRADKLVVVTAEVGGTLDKTVLGRFGLTKLRPAANPVVDVGLSLTPMCVPDSGSVGPKELEMRVPRGTSTGVYASFRASKLRPDEYQLVQITERSGSQVLGGYTYIIVAGKEGG